MIMPTLNLSQEAKKYIFFLLWLCLYEFAGRYFVNILTLSD